MALTLSGNEITDATRATATDGDGRAAESSFGVWEATTNLIANGGFETNTTGWTAGGTNTIARDTGQFKFGVASAKCTYQDNATMAQFNVTLTAALHSGSLWVYVPSTFDGAQLNVQFNGFTGATGTILVNLNMGLTDQWQRVRVPNVLIDAGGLVGSLRLVATGAAPSAGKFVYIDGAQIEQQPVCTPYKETDGGAAARSAARVQIPVADILDETTGWVAFRIRAGWDNSYEPLGGAGFPTLFEWGDDANNGLKLDYDESGNQFVVRRTNAGVGGSLNLAKTVTVDEKITVVMAWTSAHIRGSVNGAAFTETADTNIPTLAATLADLLDNASAGAQFDSDVFWFLCGTGVLDDADAATISGFGDTDPTVLTDLPVTADFRAIWPADDSSYTFGMVLATSDTGSGSDSVLGGPDSDDAGALVETSMVTDHILRRIPTGTALTNIADGLGHSAQRAIFVDPTTKTFCCIYQAGNQGATGLVFRTSTDGVVWGSETQISTRQDVYASGVINPATGDIHLLYSKNGDPSLSSAWSVWYRALAFTGATWSVGGEVVFESGSASQGLSNVTAMVYTTSGTSVNHIAAFYYKKTASSAIIRAGYGNSNWDVTSRSGFDEITMPIIGECHISPAMGLDGTNYERTLVVEQAGTYRVYASTDSSAFTLSQTFFGTTGGQFALCWNPAPSGFSNGVFGIVDLNTNQVRFRTWDPATNTMSAATVVAADGQSVGLTRDGSNWIVVWTATESGNARYVKMAFSNALTVVFYVDTDPGADGWGHLKTAQDTQYFDMLMLGWCDTLDPGLDNYNVYFGSFAIGVLRSVADAFAAAATLKNGPAEPDTGTGVETGLVAGEAKAASDAGGGSEIVSLKPTVLETGHGVAALVEFIANSHSEAGRGVATLDMEPTLNDDTGSGAETLLAEDEKATPETGSGAETTDVGHPAPEAGHAASSLAPAMSLPVAASGVDSVVGGPDASDTAGAVESFDSGFDVQVADAVQAVTLLGSAGFSGTPHHDILAFGGSKVTFHPGLGTGWAVRGLVDSESHMVMRAFEDVDTDYAGIVFALEYNGQMSADGWRQGKRSSDGGLTFFNILGFTRMGDVAISPDGTLWALGNDGTTPATVPSAIYNQPDGMFGYRKVSRQIFKSTNRGVTWSKIYDDQAFGRYGRYPFYYRIQVDPNDPNRIMACGMARGAVLGREFQVIYSTDGGATWHIINEPSGPGCHFTSPPAVMLALDDGRFMWAGESPGLITSNNHRRIWTTDNMGATWDLRYDIDQSNVSEWSDAVFRNGKIFAFRDHISSADPTADELMLYSVDNGGSFTAMTAFSGAGVDGKFVAAAYDPQFDVLYAGTNNGSTQFVYRMDGPPSGSWVSMLEDAVTVIPDADPDVSQQSLAVLSTITGTLEIGMSDLAHGVESALPITVLVSDSGAGAETADFAFNIFDAAAAAEVLALLKRTALTVRVFMHRGRAIIKVEGTTGSAVTNNPSG